MDGMANPSERDNSDSWQADSGKKESYSRPTRRMEEEEEQGIEGDQEDRMHGKFTELSSTLRLAVANGALNLESESSDLVVDLVQSLMIDRLKLEPTAATATATTDKLQKGEVMANVEPLLAELDTVSRNCRQLEESERRIQTELYESADYTKSLMQQLAISNELNEL